ncbi:hypothetical protein ABT404_06355 [Streptomyces hyaluromycini]|uniref:Uncharacterized protein n=1 Tax=Streptomyces hyaluromycini TaxID=1377993 RepID=A0ABV1WQG7_9ACTN
MLVGQDWDTFVIDSDDPALTEPALLPLITGLAEGACSCGAVTRDQTDGWIAGQRARAEADRLFLALPMFMTAATAR